MCPSRRKERICSGGREEDEAEAWRGGTKVVVVLWRGGELVVVGWRWMKAGLGGGMLRRRRPEKKEFKKEELMMEYVLLVPLWIPKALAVV